MPQTLNGIPKNKKIKFIEGIYLQITKTTMILRTNKTKKASSTLTTPKAKAKSKSRAKGKTIRQSRPKKTPAIKSSSIF